MKRSQCGFITPLSQMSDNDRAGMEKFKSMLQIHKARKDGADPYALALLEQALYPEGIGREPPDGVPDA